MFADSRPPADTQKEYKVVRALRGDTRKEAENPEAQLNDLAADGWQFVDTIDYTGGGTKYLVFERPIRSEVASDGSDEGGNS